MSHTMPKLEKGPLGELLTECSDDEVSPEFFSSWVQMIKIESIVPYYSGGPSSKKFRDRKRKIVVIFEKAQVLEQYWVQITNLHLLE